MGNRNCPPSTTVGRTIPVPHPVVFPLEIKKNLLAYFSALRPPREETFYIFFLYFLHDNLFGANKLTMRSLLQNKVIILKVAKIYLSFKV